MLLLPEIELCQFYDRKAVVLSFTFIRFMVMIIYTEVLISP
jgi:hypothetical protein